MDPEQWQVWLQYHLGGGEMPELAGAKRTRTLQPQGRYQAPMLPTPGLQQPPTTTQSKPQFDLGPNGFDLGQEEWESQPAYGGSITGDNSNHLNPPGPRIPGVGYQDTYDILKGLKKNARQQNKLGGLDV